jgi:glycosyltransferase involved in cell wall biosynthesis
MAVTETLPARQTQLHVAAFTGGGAVASARLRVRQYTAPLADFGIVLRESWPALGAFPPSNRALRPAWLIGTMMQRLPPLAASWTSDIVLLQRELVSTFATLERLTRRPRLVDIDDAVHLHRSGRAARRLAELADLVVVGNAWLAEVWRQWSATVEILPTAVDTALYRPKPPPLRPSIGWIGNATNLHYLDAIAPALERVVQRFPDAEVAVCCDRPPNLHGVPVRWVPWSEEVEAPFLASISIGVMPLADGPWERGKCSFKMLQYMAASRPCVATPVGMNAQLLSEAEFGLAATSLDEWSEALASLLADRDGAQTLGAAGRRLAEECYSVAALAPRLADLLRRLV